MTTKDLKNGMVSIEAQDGFVLMRDGDATDSGRAALVPADTVGDWREVSIEDVEAEQQRQQRMAEIQAELQSMDYLTSKFIDGEDMSDYGDWQERRRALRAEYNELEAKQNV